MVKTFSEKKSLDSSKSEISNPFKSLKNGIKLAWKILKQIDAATEESSNYLKQYH